MATNFRADFTKSLGDVSGNNTKISHGDADDIHGGAYFLNGQLTNKGGNHIQLARDTDFFAQRQIEFGLDFKAAKAGDGGSLFRIHNSIQIDVGDNGDVTFRLIGNAKGEKGTITARGVKTTDGDWHNVKLAYDADAGKMTGYVDGKAVGSIKVTAATKAAEYWDPMIGSPWENGFRGHVDNVSIAGKGQGPSNKAPVGGADSYKSQEDEAVRMQVADLLKNDSDINGDAMTVTGVRLASGKGTVELVGGKEIVFTPNKDWSGKAVVNYTVEDVHGAKATVPVSIDVVKNSAPKGGADTYTTAEDTPLHIKLSDITKNDSDVNGDALTVTAARLASGKGTVTFTAGNEIVFTPGKDWAGKAVIEYTLKDDQGAQVKVPVSVSVTEVAEAPVVTKAPLVTKAPAKGIVINSSQELETALTNAKGGETFLLRGDVEYKAVVRSMKAHSDDVLVTSLDPNDRAVITKLELDGANKVTFDHLRFEFKGTAATNQTDVVIRKSSDIAITDSEFKGLATAYVNTGGKVAQSGVQVRDTNGFTFEGNEVSNFFQGVSVGRSQNISIRDNDLHHNQGDGLKLSEVKGITIENNWFHDFLGTSQDINHSDYIQFFTANTTSSSENIVIRGNLLAKGEYASQSIFIRDDLGDANASSPTRFKNVLIEDNFIENWHHHGITLMRGDGVIIRDNTLGMMTGGEHKMVSSINVHNSTGVQLTGNITPKSTLIGTNQVVRNDDNAAPTKLIANIAAEHDGSNGYVFDGRYTVNANGWVKGGDATFTWNFGDGTKATGAQASHKYANGAEHQVVLTVLHKDGTTDTAQLRAGANVTSDPAQDANGSLAFLHHSDPWGV
jgi:hypothetical protein